jgi:inner membrane protein
MDNLSHSVVGLAVGELVHRSLPQELDASRQSKRRRLLLFSCWGASNFPDLDYFLTPLLPAPLGYLLHHRGHTHTLIYAIPQAVLLAAMIWLFWPSARKVLKESATARRGVAITLTLGFASHLLMDYLNSYGIHPFHPFDSRWLYGDMVFILEPMFWISFGVPLAMMVKRLTLKVPLLAMLVGVLFFFTLKGYLLWGSLAVLLVLAMVLGTLQHRAGPFGRSALIGAMVLNIGFIGVQNVASSKAKQILAELLHNKDPVSKVLDTSMSSFPTNPLCWTFVSVESNEQAGTYRLRRGFLTLASNVVHVDQCPHILAGGAVQSDGNGVIAFAAEREGSLEKLRKLKAENCHFEAWLRFARAPAVTGTEASDLRFGLNPEKNFTAINFEEFENRECSSFIPGWGFPRSDLLTPLAAQTRSLNR